VIFFLLPPVAALLTVLVCCRKLCGLGLDSAGFVSFLFRSKINSKNQNCQTQLPRSRARAVGPVG